MTVLASLETIKVPLASTLYILLQDLSAYLEAGLRKTSSGSETDCLLAKLPCHEKEVQIRSFQISAHYQKLEGHLHMSRICDPRQLPTISKGFDNHHLNYMRNFSSTVEVLLTHYQILLF